MSSDSLGWALDEVPSEQNGQLSFIGGRPRLPLGMGIPVCKLCTSPQSFFFQIAMPDDALWKGTTVAVFQCTSCQSDEHYIPEMLKVPLLGADIPKGFLDDYQQNFGLLVFPTGEGQVVDACKPQLKFRELQLKRSEWPGSFGKLGGSPCWLLDDESPATYGGASAMHFLFQTNLDFRFETVENADPQMIRDIWGELVPEDENHYRLFISNALYFFGTDSISKDVYLLTQVD